MKNLIAVVIVAGVGFGVWKYWPQIVGENGDGKPPESKSKEPVKSQKTVGAAKSTQQKSVPVPPKREKFAVEWTLELVAEQERGNPVFIGMSNLPPGTEIMFALALEGEDMQDEPSIAYVDENGRFRFDFASFGRNVNMLRVSVYPKANIPEIQKVLGPEGDLLEGPFVQATESQGRILRGYSRLIRSKLKFTSKKRRFKILLTGKTDRKD